MGDKITLDVLTDIREARQWTAVELVLLVDSATEAILNSSLFGWSSDDVAWVGAAIPFSDGDTDCYDRTWFHAVLPATILRRKPRLTACNTVCGNAACKLDPHSMGLVTKQLGDISECGSKKIDRRDGFFRKCGFGGSR